MDQPNHKPNTKKVSEIIAPPYGFYIPVEGGGQRPIVSDPTPEDIADAIKNNKLEKRGFQSHGPELQLEWKDGLPENLADKVAEYGRRSRIYHARRIAFFVVNGWEGDPIRLKPDGVTMHDGLHRLKAAIYLKIAEVEVEILEA